MNTLFRLHFGRNMPETWNPFSRRMETKVSEAQVAEYLEGFSKVFAGFTVIQSVGFWEGKCEPSFVIELLEEDSDEVRAKLEKLAEVYCKLFRQDLVLIYALPVTATNLQPETNPWLRYVS